MKASLSCFLFLTLALYSQVKCQRRHLSFAEMKKDYFDFEKLQPINSIYKDCGSVTGSISDVLIKDCTKPPCIFHKGSNYTLNLKFSSKVNSKSIKNSVAGVIAHIPIPFPLPDDNGCDLGISCPVKAGDALSESVTLPILNEYPKINLFVKWQVTDDQNKEMICFIFPVSIQ